MKRLDRWWEETSSGRRLDREPYHLVVMVVFLCLASSLILIGPVPGSSLSELSPDLQDAMALTLFTGCLLSLIGAAAGPPLLRLDRRHCYRLGIISAPLVTTSTWVLGGATILGVESWTSALAGIGSPILGLSVALQACLLWLEIRRLDRGVVLRNGGS